MIVADLADAYPDIISCKGKHLSKDGKSVSLLSRQDIAQQQAVNDVLQSSTLAQLASHLLLVSILTALKF